MSKKIIAIAENGQPLTQPMLDKWCEEYEAGNYCLENEETTAAFFWGGVHTYSFKNNNI